MNSNPLASLSDYSQFVAELLDRSTVLRSTLAIWSDSPYTGIAEGEIFFSQGIKLRVREEFDFDAALITSYGYEVYRHEERLYWYDDFPHPNDPDLASSHPHHKHVPPDIKHHRIPAPSISFTQPTEFSIINVRQQIAGSVRLSGPDQRGTDAQYEPQTNLTTIKLKRHFCLFDLKIAKLI